MIYSLNIQKTTQVSKTFFIWKGKETGKERKKQHEQQEPTLFLNWYDKAGLKKSF